MPGRDHHVFFPAAMYCELVLDLLLQTCDEHPDHAADMHARINVQDPYLLSANLCGSSTGSSIAAAANMAAATLGTETMDSILCPASLTELGGRDQAHGWVDKPVRRHPLLFEAGHRWVRRYSTSDFNCRYHRFYYVKFDSLSSYTLFPTFGFTNKVLTWFNGHNIVV